MTVLTVQKNAADAHTRLGRERREGILVAAIDVIARYGFVGASLSRVAEAAGLEKGHLTYYFKTKDDLLFEIVDDLHQQFVDGLDRWIGEADPTPELQLPYIFDAHVRLVCALHKQTRVSYESMRFLTGQRHAAVAAKRYVYEIRMRELIEGARASMSISDISTSFLVKSILGMLNWPYQWYSSQGTDSPEQIARLLSDRVMAALRP